ncbi:MAG: hypothetical protein JW957_04720 [Candidatus Omnitrophica bacterium]|nr:hypothetical protein [Candidatus Omnitrophota bacterium]
MNGRERLLKTFNGESVDRIPVSLYEFDGFYDSWIYNYPEYAEILEYAKGKTDKMYFWRPEGNKPSFLWGEVEKEMIDYTTWEEKKAVHTKTTIKTPLGEISDHTRADEGVHTSWTIENFCKDIKDAERLLSIPYIPSKPDVSSFSEKDRKVGEEGILMADTPDPLCSTVEMFGFTKFLMVYMENPEIIFKLMKFFHERIFNNLEHLLKNGAVTIYRIVGPEYATPPYLRPEEFDKLVTPFDKELVSLLHRYGAKARLHSHGRIKKALNSFLEMGIDATDPVEPPPDGDVSLRDARETLGEKCVLIGNIEERLFEVGSKKDMEEAVKKAMDDAAGKGPFVLCPTAMPLTTPLDKKIQENIIHYIDSGIKYGKL